MLALFPHLHARGKSFRFDLAHRDDFEEELNYETILDVPRYDFNWQHTYHYVKPIAVAKGDRLRLTAVYDNSDQNPLNPDPTKTVYWGEQTFEEMLVGYVTYVDGSSPNACWRPETPVSL